MLNVTYAIFSHRAVLTVVGYAPETVDIQIFVPNTPAAVAGHLAKYPGAELIGYTD